MVSARRNRTGRVDKLRIDWFESFQQVLWHRGLVPSPGVIRAGAVWLRV